MNATPDNNRPVLILGAGINGCALARELTLNNISVVLVDKNDIAFGATSRSSRLIHGGLRYLEYGEFRLVRESLAERRRLLQLAPQFVRPLRLYIPVRRRGGGLWYSLIKFLSGSRIPFLNRLASRFRPSGTRGLWLVKIGLRLYDFFSRDPDLPGSSLETVSEATVPRVNREAFRWVCAYTDAQMQYPERFTLAMLADAQRLADRHEAELKVLTHATARLAGDAWQITTADGSEFQLTPSAVVNATGAWGDWTLDELGIETPRLFGGTRGSHLLTSNKALRAALGDAGIYAETDDGRLVFILPFGNDVLVGTTDVRFSEGPDKAVATVDELDYLIELVNDVMAATPICRDDVFMHYSGIRPLPYQADGKTAAISREHSIHRHRNCQLPTFTLVGGKLTTCRAFAELVSDQLFEVIGAKRLRSSHDLPFAGSDNYPVSEQALAERKSSIARDHQLPLASVDCSWDLLGTRTGELLEWSAQLSNSRPGKQLEQIDGTQLPLALADWAIEHEWAGTLDDLVERRLMLVYREQVTEKCLRQLAGCLVDHGLLPASAIESTVDASAERLYRIHGKTITRGS